MHDTAGITVAVTLLIVLALADLMRNRTTARIKEYGFLLAVSALSMVYGLLHDALTLRICPEYFIVGKGIESASRGFSADVVELALKASSQVGLLVGVVLLVANNPSRRWPQLPYATLGPYLWMPLSSALIVAGLLGVGATSGRVAAALGVDEWGLQDPVGFVTVWAVHIGTYVGATIGSVVAAVAVQVRRRRQVCSATS